MLDASVNEALRDALEHLGYYAVRSPGAGARVSPDDIDVIRVAAEAGCILVSTDSHILADYFVYVNNGNHHPGLILCAQRWPAGKLIANVRHTLQTLDPDNLRNTYVWAHPPP
jgi:Holliday junction resolvase